MPDANAGKHNIIMGTKPFFGTMCLPDMKGGGVYVAALKPMLDIVFGFGKKLTDDIT